MFAGITALALAADVHMAENAGDLIGLAPGAEQKTALSQIGLATFGETRCPSTCFRASRRRS